MLKKYNSKISYKKDRLYMSIVNNKHEKITIIEYNNCLDIVVEFDDSIKTKVKTRYSHFLSKSIINPNSKSVNNIGFIGQGDYKSRINSIKTVQYICWTSMFNRCYNEKYHKIHPTYIGCSVCEEWHNFQTFAKWYDENYYSIENEQIQLDKDILLKDNKIYSSETCVFVPQRINKLFTKTNSKRGNFPIGVNYFKNNNNYVAKCKYNNKIKHIGCYSNPEDAFIAYKSFKECYIKEIANNYKQYIPNRLYYALINYNVSEND